VKSRRKEKQMASKANTNTEWRIEREPVKLFFCVVRDGEDGKEYVRSASGRASIFKTYKAAQRAQRRVSA
jgi:hypothetical protein